MGVKRWAGLLGESRFARLASLPFEQAREEAAAFLAEVAAGLPAEVRGLMQEPQTLAQAPALLALAEGLDALQFALQEGGQQVAADQAFAAARLRSARVFLDGARSTGDLMDAVYEACLLYTSRCV